MTETRDITPKTTEHNLIVCTTLVNLKPKLLIIKDCARGIVLLKLTTDRREASRGLSATAELFFVECAMHYDVALV